MKLIESWSLAFILVFLLRSVAAVEYIEASSLFNESDYQLIYQRGNASATTIDTAFTIIDPLLGDKASCKFNYLQNKGGRPAPIPLNNAQPCDPKTFQFKIVSRESGCSYTMTISHSITPIGGNYSTALKEAEIHVPCPNNTAAINGTGSLIKVIANISTAPDGWVGDKFTVPAAPASNHTVFYDSNSTYSGPHFLPSETFNETIANGSIYPGQLPTFFGCACNCSYVSYGCCDSPNGIVSEPAEKNLGHLDNCGTGTQQNNTNSTNGNTFEDVAVPSVQLSTASPSTTASGASASASGTESDTHHVCSGYCYGAARVCSWGYTGDCKCSAPKNEILFWQSAPCVATEQNPNKEHDKRKAVENPSLKPGYRGPRIDPGREAGICNSSYISYACANAPDGIVHEPLTNWLGAMLPQGVKEYPPIPQEFLDIHGIKNQPYLGPIDLPFW